ncbi:GMC family oxidoreductase [Deinococcus cavernae]|nr:GMC family oxidoreductase [Deinococcus cavernae]
MTQLDTLTDPQRRTLAALMDTFLPALNRRDDPHGFYAHSARTLGVPAAAEGVLADLPAADRAGLLELLDKLRFVQKLERTPLKVREGVLRLLSRDPRAARGLEALRQLTLMLGYAQVGEDGLNPTWKQFAYAGPTFQGAQTQRDLTITVPQAGQDMHADVVVIGSGAGGGVIAGELAGQGLKVVVLDMGRHFADAELGQSELWAYRNIYWHGGFTTTADGNVSLIAGQAVGGGTVGNWMNCVPTPAEVRQEWAGAGLSGLNTPEFEGDLRAVMRRIQANNDCSESNGTHQRLIEGSLRLGYSFKRAYRNADPRLHDPQHAGHCGFGDATGSKQSTAKTYLKDAQQRGAVIVEGVKAERILTQDGVASGVLVGGHAAGESSADRTPLSFTVHAPQVVVACGALETPALLLRSGLGGPAVGQHLHLHPCGALAGLFDHDQRGWWGATQGTIMDEFQGRAGGYGFLVETIQYTTGLYAVAAPWFNAADHKERMAQQATAVSLIHLTRDRGAGQVTLDENGEPVITYSVTDPVDVDNYWLGQATVARILEAAGAHTIYPLTDRAEPWRRGEDLEAAIGEWRTLNIGQGGHPVFSAHQMGSARLGRDPRTSVADPSGELHGVPGVWIGDTSAFPSASGANPMLTVMALARRTSRFIAQRASAGRPSA